ncbi:MAG: hypothetical protein IPM42_20645 [Saprospiraceae bacterium]|nr:hypothetical protein [Saprospiraceae bacterium]
MANIINSKNESKSQHLRYFFDNANSCGKYHKFKERKQITTALEVLADFGVLWQIS